MYTWTGDSHIRFNSFDRLQTVNCDALRDPNVIRLLGGWAEGLTKLNDGAFLPDLDNDGIFSLPSSQRDTNNVALLPLVGTERKGVLLDASMYLPTSQRTSTFLEAGGTKNDLLQISADLARRSMSHSVLDSRRQAKTRSQIEYQLGRGGLFLTTRPVIYFDTALTSDDTPKPLTAAVGLHEFVHAQDLEGLTERQVFQYAVCGTHTRLFMACEGELRACHAGAMVLQAANWPYSDDRNLQVERLRIQHTQEEAPFTPTELLMDEMVTLGACASPATH